MVEYVMDVSAASLHFRFDPIHMVPIHYLGFLVIADRRVNRFEPETWISFIGSGSNQISILSPTSSKEEHVAISSCSVISRSSFFVRVVLYVLSIHHLQHTTQKENII